MAQATEYLPPHSRFHTHFAIYQMFKVITIAMAPAPKHTASIAKAEDVVSELEARLKEARSRLELLKLDGAKEGNSHLKSSTSSQVHPHTRPQSSLIPYMRVSNRASEMGKIPIGLK